MEKYFCIFGGGGIRGAAYTGVIKALKELNIEITGFGGSSIGAVVAGLYSIGYGEKEIQEVFDNINFQFFNDLNFNFGKDFALSKGENFYEWVKNKIEDKFYKENNQERKPVKFKDLEKELVIFSVDLVTSKFNEFSKEKTPDFEIAQAIRISVGMPGLYAPVVDDDSCLVDGDLLKAMPLWMASDTIKEREEKILEFRLENNETNKKISNTVDYLNAVYDSISGFASDFIINTYGQCEKYDYIKLNLEGVSVVDFMSDKNKKLKMAKTGYETTIDYFKNKYPLKKEKLSAIYNSLCTLFQKALILIKNREIEKAKYAISDIILYIIEASILEENFKNRVLSYKKTFDENYLVKKGIFTERPILADTNKIIKEGEDILAEIKSKINSNL